MANFFDGQPATEPSAVTGFAGNRIERRSEKRDGTAIPSALADRSARIYLFSGDKALLGAGAAPDPLFTIAEAERMGADLGKAILLGWTATGPRLVVTLPDGQAIDEGRHLAIDLRSLAVGATVDGGHLGALAQGRSLCHWHQRHGFCAVCGAPTTMAMGGYRRDCKNCGAEHFPRTDPVVIMLTVQDDRCILGRQSRFPPGMYSCLAGFVEPGETLEDAVRRETHEEAGITVGRVRYFASQPWPFPSSIMIGCHAEALSSEITRDEAELEDCRWFDRGEVIEILNGTHKGDIKSPPPIAIAHQIVRSWAEHKTG